MQTSKSRQLRHRFEELVAKYPCLWDPEDLNYSDKTLKAECRQELLVQYNNQSSIAITMDQLLKKLCALRVRLNRRRRENKHETSDNQAAMLTSANASPSPRPSILQCSHRFEELVAEYPCLWDPKDINFTSRRLKTESLYELLGKFNSLSSLPISMWQLKMKMKALKLRFLRRKRKGHELLSPALRGPSGEDPRGGWLSELGTSSSSTEPLNKIQRVYAISFHYCGVCGEVKSESSNGEDKPYIVNNKIAFCMNDLSIELDFDKDTTVCQNCDTKLKEMYDFLKLVKNAQDKINSVNIVKRDDEMTTDDYDEMTDGDDNDENEDHKFIIDSLKVTDTEIIKPTVQERKCEEFSKMKKQFRVTIDLNSRNDNIDDDRNTIDDIEVKYEMLKKCNVLCTKSNEAADEVSKVIFTEDSKDIILDVREGIEDDTHKDFNKIGEIVADNIKKKDIATEHKCNHENEESEAIIYDIKKEIVTDDIYKAIDEPGNNEDSKDIIIDVKKDIFTDDIQKDDDG